jgi:hypothetical protein
MIFFFERLMVSRPLYLCLLVFLCISIFGNLPAFAGTQEGGDVHTRTEFQFRVMPGGALEITETRDYSIGFFNAYFIADIKHRGLPLEGLEVALNGEVLQQRDEMPESARDPSAPEVNGVYFAQPGEEHLALYIFDVFGDRPLQLSLSYRLENVFRTQGDWALMDHVFTGGLDLGFDEMQDRPRQAGRRFSLEMQFETPPEDQLLARAFAAIGTEPVRLDVDDEQGRIALRTVELPAGQNLHIRVLTDRTAVPDAGPLSGDQRLSPEAFQQEYERWLEGHQQKLEQRTEAAGQLRYWRPVGGLLLLLSLGSILRRSFRKRRRQKAVREEEATEPITHKKTEQLPLPVLKTLFDARVLQPRSHVLRLTGLGLFDLARAGYLHISSDLGPGILDDPGWLEKFQGKARRKLLPSQINGMIQRTSIRIKCSGKAGSERLPDWQQLLLSHVEELAGSEPAELRDLFPSRSQLKRMRADGRLDEIGLEQRENQMKQLKKAFIEDYYDDLISGRSYYESHKGAVYLNALALLTGVHLLLLGAVFLAFLLIPVGLIGFTLALINRYERSVEGLRYSEYLRRIYQGLREGQLETPLPSQAYITAFLVMNWPQSYNELYNRPRTPLFKMAAPGQISEAEAPLREAGWLQLNKKALKHPDKSLHLLHFIIQDLCYRSLMHYPDFRKERDSG